ncbi:hypothetical protein [Nostoc sp. ChiSLP03a]|nr:hypothetical protein [Nostoc sp. ChiSLP03a]MDZ8214504.1 hypothetical protein [Nostoc sp. ChiSLP03a]
MKRLLPLEWTLHAIAIFDDVSKSAIGSHPKRFINHLNLSI